MVPSMRHLRPNKEGADMGRRITHAGASRNWEVVGLTPENFVLVRETETDTIRDSCERPSDFIGVTYLTRTERGILRRGLTQSGYDRPAPRG